MDHFDFENLDCELIIKEVRKRPCIYDSNDEGYKNKDLRKKTWLTITTTVLGPKFEKLEPAEKTLACKYIQRRWKSLKDTFFKTLKPHDKKSTRPRRPYCYHNFLTFLLPNKKIETKSKGTETKDIVESPTSKTTSEPSSNETKVDDLETEQPNTCQEKNECLESTSEPNSPLPNKKNVDVSEKELKTTCQEKNECRESTPERNSLLPNKKKVDVSEKEFKTTCQEKNECRESTPERNSPLPNKKKVDVSEKELKTTCQEKNGCRESTPERNSPSLPNKRKVSVLENEHPTTHQEKNGCRESTPERNSPLPNKRKVGALEKEHRTTYQERRDREFTADRNLLRDADPDEMFLLSQLPVIKRMRTSEKFDFQIKFLQLLQSFSIPD